MPVYRAWKALATCVVGGALSCPLGARGDWLLVNRAWKALATCVVGGALSCPWVPEAIGCWLIGPGRPSLHVL